jgi:exodeoxyribonuclease-3
MKLLSWNVNGVRAAAKKGLFDALAQSGADVICLQEIKAHPGDVQHLPWPPGYELLWHHAEKKGYSGTATLTRVKPRSVRRGIGVAAHDAEGRVLATEWDPAFLAYLKRLRRAGKPVLFCGDLNVAHTEIDLANPRTNRRNAGFTDEERTHFTRLLDAGFIDTFRAFEPGSGHYTWWSQMSDCRARNIGWRVDYFVAGDKLRPALKRAWISPEVKGSDHCPVGLELG